MMKSSVKMYITLVGLLLFLQTVKAQTTESVNIDSLYNVDEITNYNEKDTAYNEFAEEVLGDTTVVFNTLTVNKDSINALKNKATYSWAKDIEKNLRRKQTEDENSINKVPVKETSGNRFFENIFNSLWLKGILWSAAILLVLYIIYQLFLNKGFFQRSSKKQVVEVNDVVTDDSMDNDFNSLMNKAYQAGNLKLAMRYLFLKTIQSLNEKELIRYAADKTNAVYMSELPATQRNEFAKLAMYYEYIWYGNVAISNEIFNEIQLKYQQFLKHI